MNDKSSQELFRETIIMPVIRTHHSVFKKTDSQITMANKLDHLKARFAIKRAWHRVDPGLYTLGNPDSGSPVFVTGNYSLSFDALRSNLAGLDAYIIVLDTFGVNVWCAAGKGTFGTKELIHRITDVKLADIVTHRTIILPQLGAPGIQAHIVKKETGFRVEYGPIRADDLPEYMKTHQATLEMRTVRFPLRDRMVLIPVEVVGTLLPMLGAAFVGYLLGGWITAFAVATSILAGTILFPILLPYLPTREFSFKGFVLGVLAMLPFIFVRISSGIQNWTDWAGIIGWLLLFPSITAFISLNFTGATPFTSKTGVRLEMSRYIPVMAWSFGIGIALTILLRVLDLTGVL
jgi:hypothetical protein